MATAPVLPRVYKLPANNQIDSGGGYDRMLFSPDHLHSISLDDGSVRDLPLGTRMMIVKPRRETQDWYAEIEGNRHVAAIGPTREAAFLAALDKAA